MARSVKNIGPQFSREGLAEELVNEIDRLRTAIGVDRGALIKVWQGMAPRENSKGKATELINETSIAYPFAPDKKRSSPALFEKLQKIGLSVRNELEK